MVGLQIGPVTRGGERHGETHRGIDRVPSAGGRAEQTTDGGRRRARKADLRRGVERVAKRRHPSCHRHLQGRDRTVPAGSRISRDRLRGHAFRSSNQASCTPFSISSASRPNNTRGWSRRTVPSAISPARSTRTVSRWLPRKPGDQPRWTGPSSSSRQAAISSRRTAALNEVRPSRTASTRVNGLTPPRSAPSSISAGVRSP